MRSAARKLMHSFDAIVCRSFGGPEVLTYGARDALGSPAAGQVIVQMAAAGVNPSDTYVRLGPGGPYANNPKLIPTLPFTPGKDGAGTVVAVGDGVTGLTPGARVYTTGSISGTYAAYALCGMDQLHPLPDNITFAQGACVGVPCATAYRALHLRCKVQPGDTVLVHGASGAVGLAAVQLAVAAGCVVVGTAGTAAGEAAVRAAGAVAVNHREDAYVERAMASLPADKGGKFDIVLEMAAHTNMLQDIVMLRHGGQLAVVGSKAEAVPFNPRLLMPAEVSIHGVFLSTASAAEKQQTHAALFDAMVSGALTPVVGVELPLSEAATAHKEVMQPSSGGKVGNIVLVV